MNKSINTMKSLYVALVIISLFTLCKPRKGIYPDNFDELVKRVDSLDEKWIYYYGKALRAVDSKNGHAYLDSLHAVMKKSEEVTHLIYHSNEK